MRYSLPLILVNLIISALVMPSCSARAETNTPELSARQIEIMRTVQAADGYINKNVHDEFWSLMPSEIQESSYSSDLLHEMFLEVGDERLDFLVESWRSALASLTAKRIMRTREYTTAREAILKASDNPAYQERIQESIRSSERLLWASASGQPIDTPRGKVFITSDLIDQVLSGIQASEFRVKKLVSPVWDDRVVEFRYPQAHVSLLASTPFSVERKSIKTSEGQETALVLLSRRVGASSYEMIAYSTVAGDLINPNKSVASTASAGIRGAGATLNTHVIVSDWRGRISATTMGSAETSEGRIFVAVRVIAIPEVRGLLQLMVTTDISGAEAINMRGALEDSLNVVIE